jgi:glycolate oxidase FAD binding subunit
VTSIGLEQPLRAVLPGDALIADATVYAAEGLAPPLAVRPANEEQLLDVLRCAEKAGAVVVPWGSGSQMALGMPLSRYDLAVDLTALDQVIEYEPADLTVSVQAGMRLRDLQRILAENNQWLPLDPPNSDRMTVGGMLATNASGPGRAAYGTPRDFLIGIAVATPAGEIVRSGGRVVKNVAGYDLGKLHIGALGTLGVITRASFKVAPMPAVSRTLATSSNTAGPLAELATDARRRGLALNRLCLLKSRAEQGWRLLLRLAGGEAAVEASIRQLNASVTERGLPLADADDSAWQELSTLTQEAELLVKAAVPPSAVSPVLESVTKLYAAVASYPTAGIVYGAWESAPPEAEALIDLRQLSARERGAMVVEKAPRELKLAVDVWGQSRPDIEIMRRLKDQFDPKHILNPGRFVAGI